jgi:hypothetical protein
MGSWLALASDARHLHVRRQSLPVQPLARAARDLGSAGQQGGLGLGTDQSGPQLRRLRPRSRTLAAVRCCGLGEAYLLEYRGLRRASGEKQGGREEKADPRSHDALLRQMTRRASVRWRAGHIKTPRDRLVSGRRALTSPRNRDLLRTVRSKQGVKALATHFGRACREHDEERRQRYLRSMAPAERVTWALGVMVTGSLIRHKGWIGSRSTRTPQQSP